MKTIQKTYKYILYPNFDQKILLDKHFGCNRYIYNYFLNEKKFDYLNSKKSNTYYEQAKLLTQLKKELIWLNEINSQSLQHTLRHLDTAFTNFYRGITKFPKFKSKKNKNSFHVPQHIKITDNKIYIPKFNDGIKLNQHILINGKIKNCTLIKTSTNKYYVNILVEEIYKPIEKTNNNVGIDLGINNIVITSDGKKYMNYKYLKKYSKKLKILQQHLSRKTKNSNNYKKNKYKIAKLHEKITNSRNDLLHKISKEIICKYDVICIEDLNVLGMLKNKKLSKSIVDVSWSKLILFLTYKSDWNDKKLIKINRYYPSSKTCNYCGFINQNLTLAHRNWVCPKCLNKLDRDINASKNILNEGMNLLRQELANTLVETEVTKFMKQEIIK